VVVKSVHRQLRCFTDYPALYDTYLKDLNAGSNVATGRGSGIVSRSHSSTADMDETVGAEGAGCEEDNSPASWARQMKTAYQAKDSVDCLRIGDLLLRHISTVSPYGTSSLSQEISNTFFEMVMEMCLETSAHICRVHEFYTCMVDDVALPPSPVSLVLVSRALCSDGQVEKALQIIRRDLLASGGRGDVLRETMRVEEVEATVRPIIHALVAKRDMDTVTELLKELKVAKLSSTNIFAYAVEAFASSKQLELCLYTLEAWTRSGVVLQGKPSSAACQAVFRLIWHSPAGTPSRPEVEQWAISHSLVETLLKRGVRGEVARDTCRLYIQQIVLKKPTSIQKYLTMLLGFPTDVGQWQVRGNS
jgi:hypothetical protein